MDNIDFLLKHWRAFVDERIRRDDADRYADAIEGAGVCLIKGDADLWADRGWRALWEHIDANRIDPPRALEYQCAMCGLEHADYRFAADCCDGIVGRNAAFGP